MPVVDDNIVIEDFVDSSTYSVEMENIEGKEKSSSTPEINRSYTNDGKPTMRTKAQRFWSEWKNVLLEIKYDEVDKQLNALITISTLMIGFSVLMTVGNYGPEDYASMDETNLNWRLKYDLLTEKNVDSINNIEGRKFGHMMYSIMYMEQGFNCTSSYFMVIMLSFVLLILLHFSGAADNAKYMNIWAIFNMPIFFVTVYYFARGFLYFLDILHFGAYMVFPTYDINLELLAQENSCSAHQLLNLVEGSDHKDCELLRAIYDVDTEEVIQTPSRGFTRLGIAWEIADAEDKELLTGLAVVFGLIIFFGYLVSTLVYAIFVAYYTEDESCLALAPRHIQVDHMKKFLERAGVEGEELQTQVANDLIDVDIKLFAIQAYIENPGALVKILRQSGIPAGVQLLIMLQLQEENESTCSRTTCFR